MGRTIKNNAVIDLHSHILPEMDDGSDSVDTSLKMLRVLDEGQVRVVCATSHYYRHREAVEDFVRRRQAAAGKLADRIDITGEGDQYPQIRLGAEVAFFSSISECARLDELCIEGTRTLLLEMPFQRWTSTEISEVLSLVLDRGLQIILAHPERYEFCSENKRALRRLMDLPVGIQVNADTLLHFRSRRQGLKLLTDAVWPLLGSDAHNMSARRPRLEEGRKSVVRHLGQEFLDQMDETAAWLLERQENAPRPPERQEDGD
ncbi:MAG: capsular polysaccharide biosynthesis protein [Lachnospiraceae bacterium]|nr:capsular polysaccharide biosynthesis protein [Lachnospiraceae bacterium]